MEIEKLPSILVYSSLFPHRGQPNAGVFIRERMFRVARELPVVVVVPVPWFPLQGLLRLIRPHFRPPAPRYEQQDGIDVYFPRYLGFPGILKRLDGILMAMGSYLRLRKLKKERDIELIDSHFAYPDGYAATLLGKWLKLPVTITLRGTEVRVSQSELLRPLMLEALSSATRVFSVADFLRQHVASLGADVEKVVVVGNGVDTEKFYPVARSDAREVLGLSSDDQVLISIGGLVPRKGFHRVIEVLPELLIDFPRLKYLIVGGGGPEGDFGQHLKDQVAALGLTNNVIFLGAMPSEKLKVPLSASDLFVLSTQNEGWANVFLEAMACGLPVITTKVGGNAEVVVNDDLGVLVEFGNPAQLMAAIRKALLKEWDSNAIIDYAKGNSWDTRVNTLLHNFAGITSERQRT